MEFNKEMEMDNSERYLDATVENLVWQQIGTAESARQTPSTSPIPSSRNNPKPISMTKKQSMPNDADQSDNSKKCRTSLVCNDFVKKKQLMESIKQFVIIMVAS